LIPAAAVGACGGSTAGQAIAGTLLNAPDLIGISKDVSCFAANAFEISAISHHTLAILRFRSGFNCLTDMRPYIVDVFILAEITKNRSFFTFLAVLHPAGLLHTCRS
jgi:hypothetical protein